MPNYFLKFCVQLSKSYFMPTNEFKYVKKLSSDSILVNMDGVSLLTNIINIEHGELRVLKCIISLKKLWSTPNDVKLCRCLLGVFLISEVLSGFKSRYSCVNQLLALTHETFSSFDDTFEVGEVFLDISKAFDKVCQEKIIHKLKRNGTFWNLLSLVTHFLKLKTTVVLNGWCSSWATIHAGVLHGSLLGALVFLT